MIYKIYHYFIILLTFFVFNLIGCTKVYPYYPLSEGVIIHTESEGYKIKIEKDKIKFTIGGACIPGQHEIGFLFEICNDGSTGLFINLFESSINFINKEITLKPTECMTPIDKFIHPKYKPIKNVFLEVNKKIDINLIFSFKNIKNKFNKEFLKNHKIILNIRGIAKNKINKNIAFSIEFETRENLNYYIFTSSIPSKEA